MPIIDLVPNVSDGDEFVSEMIKVRQDASVSLQAYKKAVFTIEGSIDEKTFYALMNVVDAGIYVLTPNTLVIRLRATAEGAAPFALFLYQDPV